MTDVLALQYIQRSPVYSNVLKGKANYEGSIV